MPEPLFDEAPVITINGKQYISVDEISRRLDEANKEADKQQENMWAGYMDKTTVGKYLDTDPKTLSKSNFFEMLDTFQLGPRKTVYSKKSIDRALKRYQLLGDVQ